MKLIHQLSKETGIPIGTIRFYEKSGLIKGVKKPDITTNNYLYYGDDVTDKLRFIQMAKAVGFTLQEIKEVIDAWYQRTITSKAQIDVLRQKVIQIEEKMEELQAMKRQISLCIQRIQNEGSFAQTGNLQ